VSEENVELVLRAYPAADVDLVKLARDESRWTAWLDVISPLYDPGVESVWPGLPGGDGRFMGFEGMRAALLDWTAPWEGYRTEVEKAFDCGDRVALIAPSFGRLPESDQEIKLDGASAWTVRDGKIARVCHSTKADILKVVGFADQ
jgi:ketosteroid isomerase-like protein